MKPRSSNVRVVPKHSQRISGIQSVPLIQNKRGITVLTAVEEERVGRCRYFGRSAIAVVKFLRHAPVVHVENGSVTEGRIGNKHPTNASSSREQCRRHLGVGLGAKIPTSSLANPDRFSSRRIVILTSNLEFQPMSHQSPQPGRNDLWRF